jgi:hypothetical protein
LALATSEELCEDFDPLIIDAPGVPAGPFNEIGEAQPLFSFGPYIFIEARSI